MRVSSVWAAVTSVAHDCCTEGLHKEAHVRTYGTRAWYSVERLAQPSETALQRCC